MGLIAPQHRIEMQFTSTVPPLDGATIEFAKRIAPDKCPDPKDTEREIWMKAGAARLANHLETIFKQQQESYVPA